ncbi:hypothetical protein NNC19_18025 [Clostridium sp. SHJSY1]|uniref:hypothetical protein n=1 Tax=Clostridium sp. SHJSY1 TaxID=2942483 RepID=UPI002876B8AF|nr:hypothetical protein [Clostridium sp. SHJSY1]MDS0527591.1 hypothetical protein [Clostridium sp. SHJSY1]
MSYRGGPRLGAGRPPLNQAKKIGVKIYITTELKEKIITNGIGNSFSEKACEIIDSELRKREGKNKNE